MSNRKQGKFFGLDEEIQQGLGSSSSCAFYDFSLTFNKDHYLRYGYKNF